MQELLEEFSVTQILLFIVLLIIAIKWIVSIVDWVKEKNKNAFDEKSSIVGKEEQMEAHLKNLDAAIINLSDGQNNLNQHMMDLDKKIDGLIDSDKDNIKSFLTREHHYFCYQKGWIDDYSLECCERRYEHYKEEGGNSFIEGFMEDLRGLPKQPPTQMKILDKSKN